MNDAMTPKNELEQRILAVLNEEISTEDFMQALHAAQVFMPVADDTQIKNFQRSNKIEPLLLEVEDGGKALILFSSPDRAKAFLADFPAYKGGLLVEFEWILLNIEGEYGISLNPGWDLGVDLEPQMVQRLN